MQRNCVTVPTGRILYSPGRAKSLLPGHVAPAAPKKIVLAAAKPTSQVPAVAQSKSTSSTQGSSGSRAQRFSILAGAGVIAAIAVAGSSGQGDRSFVSREETERSEYWAAAEAISSLKVPESAPQLRSAPIVHAAFHSDVAEAHGPIASAPSAPIKSEPAVIDAVHQIVRRYAPKRVDSRTLAREIVKEARLQNYDPLFVAAVIKSESAFNALARSHVGARGLMQIMPATGKWLQDTKFSRRDSRGDLTDPGYNLRLGITYLKHLEEMYSGDRVFTLVAYNWGPGKVDRASGGRNRVPREVVHYALKILNDHRRWSVGLRA